jgi:small subunit ribosomal protein S16
MLVIRFNRSGRANSAFFRIVVTESSKPAKSGFIKILGWYNPHSKDSSINKEEILRYMDNGAQVSNSMAKFLTANKISHKLIKFVPDAPGKKKSEPKETKPKSEEPKEKEEAAEEATEEVTDEATPETAEEVKAEEAPEAEAADEPLAETETKSEDQN